ncbi:hypothetical protein RSSE_c2931 [Ralstonia solanacearum]|nr:hypothetical protein RSSE_c2931 [Ralstonia solanacearum]
MYPPASASDSGHRTRAPHPGAGIRHALHPSAAYHLFNQGRVNLAVLRRGGGTHFK